MIGAPVEFVWAIVLILTIVASTMVTIFMVLRGAPAKLPVAAVLIINYVGYAFCLAIIVRSQAGGGLGSAVETLISTCPQILLGLAVVAAFAWKYRARMATIALAIVLLVVFHVANMASAFYLIAMLR